MKKEVPRNPITPKLNQRTIDLLTDLCFRKDGEISTTDAIFIFSSGIYTKEIAELVEDLLEKNVSKKVFIPGGVTRHYDSEKLQLSESDLVLEKINVTRFSGVDFVQEKKSTNTLENVLKIMEIFNLNELESILFISKSYAAGRSYLTLKKYVYQTRIFQKTYNTKYPEAAYEISRNKWYEFNFGRERVWGEFLRIEK